MTVKFSKPILTSQTTASTIFTFSTGFPGVTGSNALKQQLQSINISAFATAAGTTITTTAVRSPVNGGDGFAAIGQIDATGRDLGAVTIDGDLGRILAGDAVTTTQGLGALKVHSLGRFGTFTGATNLTSSIQGPVASLTTKTDVVEAEFNVVGGVNSTLAAVTIGGSLIGGSGDRSGYIESTGNLGAVKITGNVRGGAGFRSGAIVGSKIASVTIGGSLVGAGGNESAMIYGRGDIGPVSILGNALGSTGRFSGIVYSDAKLASLTIGGALIGGSGEFSGYVFSGADMGAVKITGDVQGGSGSTSGAVKSSGKLTGVTIGGALVGSGGSESGEIYAAGDMGPVSILGSVTGGTGQFSGVVWSDAKLATVTIGGSLVGGTGGGDQSGYVNSGSDMGAVNIKGSVQGGSQLQNGSIRSSGKLAGVTINGSLIGGSGQSTGQVFSAGTMGPVVITGDVRGGTFMASNPNIGAGVVVSDANITSVTIGGSLIGGAGDFSGVVSSGDSSSLLKDIGAVKITGNVNGGSGLRSGVVVSQGKLTSATIGGSLIGGTGDFSGFVASPSGELTTLTITGDIVGGSASGASNLSGSGVVQAGRIGTLTLGGSLIAGTDNSTGAFQFNGMILVANDIASATIKGSLIGNATNRAQIFARGQLTPVGTTDLAIGKLTVNGRVEHSLIHAGSSESLNADAQIGPVIIGGDWIASDLIAGASAGVDGKFGTADDVKLSGAGVKDVATVSSKITSIVIGGQVLGTFGGTDHFGFVAQNIGSFKVKNGGTTFPMIAGNGNDDFLVGLFGDLRVNEI